MRLQATVRGKTFSFKDVREVMAKANEEKSGDGLAGVAAGSALERVAAKLVLSEMTLAELHENPCIPYDEDEVTRLIWDELSRPIFDSVKSWTVGRLREHVNFSVQDSGKQRTDFVGGRGIAARPQRNQIGGLLIDQPWIGGDQRHCSARRQWQGKIGFTRNLRVGR